MSCRKQQSDSPFVWGRGGGVNIQENSDFYGIKFVKIDFGNVKLFIHSRAQLP